MVINKELLSIATDPLGLPGTLVRQLSNASNPRDDDLTRTHNIVEQVWRRKLSGGVYVLCFFNRDEASRVRLRVLPPVLAIRRTDGSRPAGVTNAASADMLAAAVFAAASSETAGWRERAPIKDNEKSWRWLWRYRLLKQG